MVGINEGIISNEMDRSLKFLHFRWYQDLIDIKYRIIQILLEDKQTRAVDLQDMLAKMRDKYDNNVKKLILIKKILLVLVDKTAARVRPEPLQSNTLTNLEYVTQFVRSIHQRFQDIKKGIKTSTNIKQYLADIKRSPQFKELLSLAMSDILVITITDENENEDSDSDDEDDESSQV
jgi:hypothetical protein